MPRPVLQVVIGATRPGRLGPTIAQWFTEIAESHGAFDVELVDLVDVGLPLLDEPENPARGGTYHHDHSKAWSATVQRASAFVFVVPEYNNGYNAATKNAIDYLYHEWRDKTVGIISYGGNVGAGTRAAQALKQVFLAVKAMPVHEGVNIPFVYTMLDDQGRFQGTELLAGAASTMLNELARREQASRLLARALAQETSRPEAGDTGNVEPLAAVAAGGVR